MNTRERDALFHAVMDAIATDEQRYGIQLTLARFFLERLRHAIKVSDSNEVQTKPLVWNEDMQDE